ncbi:MAG: hypothetical protein J5367_02585, partial [Lachnospiraceae bacterium]|nr:hypothetical protein [Lachnospiraceae bacterium]
MRKRRNWFRTTTAMIALIAMVLETGFSSVATMAAEITTEDGIVVNNDVVEEANDGAEDQLNIEVVPDEDNSGDDGTQIGEDVSGGDEDVNGPGESEEPEEIKGQEEPQEVEKPSESEPAQEETFEPADELKEGTLKITDSGISGSGYDEISIYVDTTGLAKKDKFRIEFSGPADASYNTVINDDLDKTSDGRYDFTNLEGGEFRVSATSSYDVSLSYKYNEDGYPTICVESVGPEKNLETSVLSGRDGSEINAIVGEGYESIKVELDTEELSDKAEFKLYVESEADAKVDGKNAKDGIIGLTKDTGSLVIEDLGDKSFKAYILTANELEISAKPQVTSVEDGVVTFTVSIPATKREYTYEDDDVFVRAMLERADAIPDDAEFIVTKVTPESKDYNYEAYIQALSENADEILGREDASINEDKVLLYDIAFYGKDENGNRVELQPEEGSVVINIQYKSGQLEEKLEVETADEVKIVHLPLKDEVKEENNTTAEATDIKSSDINIEVVNAKTSVEAASTEFQASEFSVYATLKDGKMVPSNNETFKTILGEATRYGVVGNDVYYRGHLETTIAAGEFHAENNAGWAAPRNSGGNYGQSIIGAYNGTTQITFDAGRASGASKHVVYTTPDAVYRNKDLPTTPQDKLNETNNMKFYPNNKDNVELNTTTYSETEIRNMVSNMITNAKTKSTELSNVNGYSFADAYDSQNKIFDFASRGDGQGTYYVNFKAGEYATLPTNDFTIKLGEGQRVVFNIPDDKVILKQYKAQIGSFNGSTAADANEDEICQRVIFNCYNATITGLDNAVSGTFLVPYSDFSNVADAARDNKQGPGAGWVIATTVSGVGGQEWHCVYHDMPPATGTSITLYARKTVNDAAPSGSEKFKFGLYESDSNGNQGNKLQEKQNNGQGITFDTITYPADTISQDGGTATRWYLIKEEGTDMFGYTLDERQYVVKVVVKKVGTALTIDSKQVYLKTDLNNALTGDVTDGANTAVLFNNTTPQEDVEFELKVKKYVFDEKDTHDSQPDYSKALTTWPADATFEFDLEYDPVHDGYTAMCQTPRMPDGSTKVSISSRDAVKEASFGKVKLSTAQAFADGAEETEQFWIKHYYDILAPNGQGMPWNTYYYGGRVRTAIYKYKITENRDVTLPEGYDYGYGFENESFERHVKVFVHVWKANDSDYYKLISCTTTVDGVTKTLPYEVKYLDDNIHKTGNPPCVEWQEKPVEFYNRYKKPEPKPGKTTVYGVKNYITSNKDDITSFSFRLYSEAGTGTFTGVKDSNLASRGANLSVNSDADGNFQFGELVYTKDDIGKTYHYIVEEENIVEKTDEETKEKYYVVRGKEHIRVTEPRKEFDVSIISEDGKDTLTVINPYDGVYTKPDNGRAKITNQYGASGEITFGATKTFVNESTIADLPTKTFSFWLVGGRVENNTVSEQVREPKSITISKDTPGGLGSAFFTTLKYANLDAKGTYKYTIYEQMPNELPSGKVLNDFKHTDGDGNVYYDVNGIKYDARKYHITVVIGDDGNGNLVPTTVTAGYDNGENGSTATEDTVTNIEDLGWRSAAFTNKYQFEPVTGDRKSTRLNSSH